MSWVTAELYDTQPAGFPPQWLRPGALVFRPPARGPAVLDPTLWWTYEPGVLRASDGHAGLAPEGSYPPNAHPPNALGLYDLIGNAWELTSERWGAHGERWVVRLWPERCRPVLPVLPVR